MTPRDLSLYALANGYADGTRNPFDAYDTAVEPEDDTLRLIDGILNRPSTLPPAKPLFEVVAPEPWTLPRRMTK